MADTRKIGSSILAVIGAIFVFGAFVNPSFLRPLLRVTCHRLPQRSFIWAPGLCARCTFFWIGVSVSSFIMFFNKLPASILLGLFLIVPMALDGLLQLIGLYESTNIMRLLTGLLAGTGFCILLEGGGSD